MGTKHRQPWAAAAFWDGPDLIGDVLERVSDGFVALSGDWRYTYVNSKAGEILGRRPADLIGKHIWTEFPDAMGRPFHAAYHRALAEQVPVFLEDRFPAGAGWFENRIYPIPEGLLIFFHDITDRKRAAALAAGQSRILEMVARGEPLPDVLDAMLRFIEAQVPDMLGSVLLLDPDGIHVRHGASPSLPADFTRAVDGQPIGERAGSCGTAAFRREPVIVEDIATDPLWEGYRDFALPHGLRACWSTPIFDADRRVLGTFAIYYRETGRPADRHREAIAVATHLAAVAIGRARKEAALRESEKRLRQAQKMEAIGTLAGGVAHDFNNVVAAIAGYARLAKAEAVGSPAAIRHLDAILTGSSRAGGLVRQLMAFSRQEELERKPIQLGPVVEEALKLLRIAIPASVEFEVSLASGLPEVLADSTQVHQIVMNLCTNAAHAMQGGFGRLTVGLERFEVGVALASALTGLQLGSHVRLTVGDTGHGMSEATTARIFEPFFTTKAPGEGTGLGLAVVHGIMRSHEGAIAVESLPGQGTTFRLYFPAHAGA